MVSRIILLVENFSCISVIGTENELLVSVLAVMQQVA